MNALSQMEKWVRSGLPDYRDQLHIFQNSNKQLIRMAEKNNLDGAALAYVQMTLSCVNCHKVMRGQQPHATSRQKMTDAFLMPPRMTDVVRIAKR